MSTDEIKATLPVLFVFIGVRENEGKLYNVYREAVKDESAEEGYKLNKEELMYKSRLYPCMPGGMFTIEWAPGKEGTTVRSSTAKGAGVWPSNEQRSQWITLSRGIENAHEQSIRA